MAKVKGPLQSFEARGKFADSMVFTPWKGIHSVRKYTVPANPQSSGQGDQRVIVGGLGRAVSVIDDGSDYHAEALEVAPANQTFSSALVSRMKSQYLDTVSDYETFISDFNAADDPTEGLGGYWQTEAENLGLTGFTLAYAGTTEEFSAGAMLYALAKYAYNRSQATSSFQTSPFTTDPDSYAEADVDSLVSALNAA